MINNNNKLIRSLSLLMFCGACNAQILNMHAPKSDAFANRTKGIDISRYQGDIDFDQVYEDGIAFAIAQASKGATFVDPKFQNNWQKLSEVWMQRGAYHFVGFDIDRPEVGSPEAQMKHFISQLRNAGGWSHNDIIALDIEENKDIEEKPNSTSTYESVAEVTERCVAYLKDEEGVTPYLYNRQSFWDTHTKYTPEIVKECPLWIPRWRSKEPLPEELPRGWKEWKIWQYSSKGTVKGIQGDVDLNCMKSEAL